MLLVTREKLGGRISSGLGEGLPSQSFPGWPGDTISLEQSRPVLRPSPAPGGSLSPDTPPQRTPGKGGQGHPSGASYDTSVAAGHSCAGLAPRNTFPHSPAQTQGHAWDLSLHPCILLPRTRSKQPRWALRAPALPSCTHTFSSPCASRAALPEALLHLVSSRSPSNQMDTSCWTPPPLLT